MTKFISSVKAIKKLKNWPYYFLGYLKIVNPNKIVVYKLRNGLKIKTKVNASRSVLNTVVLYNLYNPPGFDIKDGDTVIDIGAHIGIFSTFISKEYKNIKVYSYEPSKANFKTLKENIKQNGFKNIKPFNMAVCSKKGKRKLFVSKLDTSHSLIFKVENKNQINVDTTTLKNIFDDNNIKTCNFLKLDCEGAEYEILFNTPKKYLQKIEMIAMEFHTISNYSYTDLKRFLENSDFNVRIDRKYGNMLYAKNKNLK